MSKKLRKAVTFCATLSVLASSCLPLRADTAPVETSHTSHKPSVSKETSYIPMNTKTETIYVNLNHYGVPTETQVVNGYHINGTSKITDYGNYTKITNLTNYAKPVVNGEEINWTLDEADTNFYYQGTLESIEMPWNFTIRYKLNGVETKAEDLAGASGMIETIIEVTPNDNVSDYLKNNFMLQLSTSYDMGKCLSVEAPDSVNVDLGATKSITFMALPGETETFHIYVGTESFESSGFNMVMAPLQMSALSTVSDLKDAKTRIEDAFDATNDSLDTFLESTKNIQNGLSSLSTGIDSLQGSLKSIRKDDAAMDEKVEALLSNSNELTTSLQPLPEHLKTTINLVNELNTSSNTLVGHLSELKPSLEETKGVIIALQEDCQALHDTVDDLSDDGDLLATDLDHLKERLKALTNDLHRVETALGNFETGISNSEGSLNQAGNALNSLSSQLDYINSLSPEELKALIDTGALSSNDVELLTKLGGMSDDLSNISSILYNTSGLTSDSSTLAGSLKKATRSLASLTTCLEGITSTAQSITSTLTSGASSLTDTLDHLNSLLAQLDTASDIGANMITDTENIQGIMNTYTPELIRLLEDSTTLTEKLSLVTESASGLGSQLHNTIINNRQQTYNSIDQSLSGTTEALSDIIKALNTTDRLKANKDIIKNTIDEEWDKLDEDYNLLNYNPDAKPTSLISDKNKEVTSIQIILRTPEISIDKKAELKRQQETTPELTLWERIKNIFANMF